MTKVPGTVIKISNKRSNILKISLLNFDADNIPIFLKLGKKSREKKRKSIHFRPVKTVRSNTIIRLRLHGEHRTLSKGKILEHRLSVDTFPGSRDNTQSQTPKQHVKTDVGQFICTDSEFLIKHLSD